MCSTSKCANVSVEIQILVRAFFYVLHCIIGTYLYFISGRFIFFLFNLIISGNLCIIRKTLKGRKQTNKNGRGTDRQLPKTDESVVLPAGELR